MNGPMQDEGVEQGRRGVTRARRLIRPSFVVVVALAAAIMVSTTGAWAAKPPPAQKAAAGIAATGTPCVYTVTYTWNGVNGAVNAYLRVLYQVPGQQFASTAQAANVAVSGK